MLFGGILILALTLLLLLFCVSPIRLIVSFSHLGGETSFAVFGGLGLIKVNLMPLLSRKKDKKTENTVAEHETDKTKENEETKKKLSFHDFEKMLSMGIETVRYLKKKLTVKIFILKARFALGDAADTGIVTGAAYSSIYNILGLCDHYFILKKHEVVITPIFQGFGFEADFQCELRLRLVHAIGLILKIRKGDVK